MVPIDLIGIATAVGLGLLGASASLACRYLENRKWVGWKYAAAFLFTGGMSAFVWYIGGLPNHLNTFLAGFAGPDVLSHLYERYRRRYLEGGEK